MKIKKQGVKVEDLADTEQSIKRIQFMQIHEFIDMISTQSRIAELAAPIATDAGKFDSYLSEPQLSQH